MDRLDGIDLSLFSTFDAEECGPVALQAARLDADVVADARRVLLELKSADAAAGAEELRLLLSEMTREMRDQFSAFRALRAQAEEQGMHGDEAAQKLARADLKAATDAMSLIVRTLEKIDSLQRQLARDRAEEAERQGDEGGFEEALRDVQALIEARAKELLATWLQHKHAGTGEPGGALGTGPPGSAGADGGNP
ncbi:hypothetical protein [Rhizobium sp. FY34]|uniref:hypothetical protein n=1 Tax=Rhizobium sp. FY34 TaxID=2562309 RepID=UPI001FEF8EBB|nr:hypothetical protein [Rhizobium sp. FY34]